MVDLFITLKNVAIFCYSQYRFMSFYLVLDLLTVVSGRIAGDFKKSVIPRFSVGFGIVVFSTISGFIKFQVSYFSLFCFFSAINMFIEVSRKSLQKYPANVGVLLGSILAPKRFLLYIDSLPDNICNNVIYADDSTVHPNCDQVPDL